MIAIKVLQLYLVSLWPMQSVWIDIPCAPSSCKSKRSGRFRALKNRAREGDGYLGYYKCKHVHVYKGIFEYLPMLLPLSHAIAWNLDKAPNIIDGSTIWLMDKSRSNSHNHSFFYNQNLDQSHHNHASDLNKCHQGMIQVELSWGQCRRPRDHCIFRHRLIDWLKEIRSTSYLTLSIQWVSRRFRLALAGFNHLCV